MKRIVHSVQWDLRRGSLLVFFCLTFGWLGCQPTTLDSPSVVKSSAEAGTPIVIGTTLTIDSEVLESSRNVAVYLPFGYEQREENWPVVYLVDGGVEQDFIPVAGFAALATLSGQYEEFILVGIETVDRRHELTTPSTVAFDVENLPTNGGADEFRTYIREEVQPLIDDTYRTSGENAILGESLAGFFIVDTFLRAPSSFDHYIAVSPSVWWEERALTLSAAGYLAAEEFPANRSIYLTAADEEDILDGLEPLVQALEDHGREDLRWRFDPMPEEHHHTIYHPATLKALRWLFEVPTE